jgi:hypothetical protein
MRIHVFLGQDGARPSAIWARTIGRGGIAPVRGKLYHRFNATGTEATALRCDLGSSLDYRIAGPGKDGAAVQGRLL